MAKTVCYVGKVVLNFGVQVGWPLGLSHLLCLDLSSAHMRVQAAAFISFLLAFFAVIDYVNSNNCELQENLPTEKSVFCAIATNDKPGIRFICCTPNKLSSTTGYGLLGAWFLAFSVGLCGGTIYCCDLIQENCFKQWYETAEVEQGEVGLRGGRRRPPGAKVEPVGEQVKEGSSTCWEASTALPMPATQAAAY
jgi:hypothetical protein